MTKISALSDIGTSVASNDTFVLVDVSDPTTPNKKIQQQNLFLIPDGSQGTPALRFLNDTDVGLYRPTTNALGLVTGGSERLRIDSSGRVGIGTSSPSAELDVNGDVKVAAGTDSKIYCIGAASNANHLSVGSFNTAGASYFISQIAFGSDGAFGNNGVIKFYTAPGSSSTTERMRIDSSGRVGIGTTTPTDNLHLHEASSNANFLHITNDTTGSTGGDGVIVGLDSSEQFYIYSYENNNLIFGNNNTERARIDSSGRLLVGTSSAVAPDGTNYPAFQVNRPTSSVLNASILIKETELSTSWPRLIINKNRQNNVMQPDNKLGSVDFYGDTGSSDVPGADIRATAETNWTSSSAPTRLEFRTTATGATSPTERMRIAQNGATNMFTSTTSGLTVATAETASGSIALAVRNGSTTPFNGPTVCVIRADGDLENTNNSYGALSDLKLKENIVDANSQWSDIKALQVRKYNFKEGQTHTQIGLIAQEVELVSPGLVSESPDRDEDGNDLGTVTKSVNYSVLYMKAVKALQEAMERIETLEQRLNDAGIN